MSAEVETRVKEHLGVGPVADAGGAVADEESAPSEE